MSQRRVKVFSTSWERVVFVRTKCVVTRSGDVAVDRSSWAEPSFYPFFIPFQIAFFVRGYMLGLLNEIMLSHASRIESVHECADHSIWFYSCTCRSEHARRVHVWKWQCLEIYCYAVGFAAHSRISSHVQLVLHSWACLHWYTPRSSVAS